jgi:hypothetical protein
MAGEKKETATRDENGVRKQSYKRFKPGRDYEEIETAQAVALCDMMLDGFKRSVADAERGKGGRPRKLETVEEFREVAERYINYIKDRALDGVRLVPDIEGFCAFAGISRETLNNWETARPGAYSDTIKIFKNIIAAYKKQLAFNGEIPPIVFATDFNNNHGYTQAAQKIDLNVGKQAQELPTAADIVQRLPVETGGTDPAELPDDLENL